MNGLFLWAVIFLPMAEPAGKPMAEADAEINSPKRILLLGQGPDGHPPTTHEFLAGIGILERCLSRIDAVRTERISADEPWTDGPEKIDQADGIVLYLTQGGQWMVNDPARRAALDRLRQRRGAIVALHWAIGNKSADPIATCIENLGGCHGGPDRKYIVTETALRRADPRHPIVAGLEDFRIRDEFYYQLKFAADRDRIVPILQAEIGDQPQTVAWGFLRPDGGRSFGFSGGHFHRNWETLEYRRLVCQAILWTLELPIPADGLDVHVSAADLALPATSR